MKKFILASLVLSTLTAYATETAHTTAHPKAKAHHAKKMAAKTKHHVKKAAHKAHKAAHKMTKKHAEK